MSVPRVIPPAHGRSRELRARRANTVLADRNQAVVAVGAWVEGGQEFQEHPADLALLTEELQAEKMRENEQSLQRFQHEVRHRVAQISKKRRQLQKADAVQRQQIWAQHVPAGQKQVFVSPQKQKHVSRVMQRSAQEPSEGMRQVRLRLAACRMSPHGGMTSDLPGGDWNGHISDSHALRPEQEVEEEEEGEDLLFTSQHEGPLISSSSCHQVGLKLDSACYTTVETGQSGAEKLPEPAKLRGGKKGTDGEHHQMLLALLEIAIHLQQSVLSQARSILLDPCHTLHLMTDDMNEVYKVSEHELWDISRSQPDPGFKSDLQDPQVLWPLPDQEEVNRQRQSHFLMQRRLFMNMEREQVKANKQHRKHLKRTSRIKAEKEQIRLEEERKLESVRQLAEARHKLEERELQILESLKLEEEERVLELEKRRRLEKGRIATRFIKALRAQMKERMSQEKLEPPPLCYCASSFWDSHPDTCANNCVFYNNPKAYAQALHSAMLMLDFQ